MEEIERIYEAIAENDKAFDENRQQYGRLRDELKMNGREGERLEEERKDLKSRLIGALETGDICGVCLKSKKEEAMCQLAMYEKDRGAVSATTAQEGVGFFVNYISPEELARDWTPVPLREYAGFRDAVLRDLREIVRRDG